MAAAGDAHATLQADIDFHNFIYEASGNPLVLESMQLHWQHLRRSMGEVLQRPRFTEKVWREHAAILDAIAARDRNAASRLIAEHVREAQRARRRGTGGGRAQGGMSARGRDGLSTIRG